MTVHEIAPSSTRDNAGWLADLDAEGSRFDAAVADLRDFVLRAVLVYLSRQRAELAGYAFDEVKQFAEDWAQRGVMQILKHRGTFAGRSKFTTWAYRIAINLTAAELRRKRWTDVSLDALEDGSPAAPLRSTVDRQLSPDASLQQHEIWDAISTIIENDLSVRQRTALTAVVLDDVPVDVVAERLATNRNNVYKILHDARTKVRRRLEASDWSAGDVLAAFEAYADG